MNSYLWIVWIFPSLKQSWALIKSRMRKKFSVGWQNKEAMFLSQHTIWNKVENGQQVIKEGLRTKTKQAQQGPNEEESCSGR